MSTAALLPAKTGILRHSPWDALLIALAALHGGVLLAVPAAPVIALGLWWNSNTIAHYFIHKPFFRSRLLNVLFSCYLSVLLGLPQTLWRDRHLAHHAGVTWRMRWRLQTMAEALLILTLWALLLAFDPWFFGTVYLPGYLAGLGLCSLHGYFEHSRGTTSHYGALYNWLFLNDGYHAEHHARPKEHWTRLVRRRETGAVSSRWPAVLRWLDVLSLENLERGVLRSALLQRVVLAWHERAFRKLLPRLPPVRRALVVGGGLFPRTLLILRRLLPQARLIVIDRSADNLRAARALTPVDVQVIHDSYDARRLRDIDLVVFPLAFVGDRQAIYARPPAPAVLVHDWVWRRRGAGAVISLLLLKRLNLVTP
jgi:hypothetical protein